MLFFILVFLIVIVIYLYGTRTYDYWSKRGIKHDPTWPFFGTNAPQFLHKISVAGLAAETYRRYPEEKVVGFYRGLSPELVIRDPEIVKRILVTDSQHFYDRGLLPSKKFVETLTKNLFFLDGDTWHLLRKKMSAAFSTGKLKVMFPIIVETTKKLQMMAEKVSMADSYNVLELMATYTTEAIGAAGFGIDMNCINNENTIFRKIGRRIVQRTPRDAIVFFIKFLFPDYFAHLNIFDPLIESTIRQLVRTVMTERNYKPCGRGDFIDLILMLKDQGSISGKSIETKNADGSPVFVELELDEELIVSQVFLFFGAGFETSSTTSAYTLHQLAYNPDCQKKAQDEIDMILAKYDNEITFDALKEMTYLQMAVSEALRLFPSVSFLSRSCSSPEYTIPEINLTLQQGARIIIPTIGLHRDPLYFKNPDQFDPERFHPDNKAIITGTYVPFGEGPRSCIGAKLGAMQSMAGLVAILHKFTVEPAACSVRNPFTDPASYFAESIVGGLPLKLRKRK